MTTRPEQHPSVTCVDCGAEATHECGRHAPTCDAHKSSCCRPIVGGVLRTNLARARAAALRRSRRFARDTPLKRLSMAVGAPLKRLGMAVGTLDRDAWEKVPIDLLHEAAVHLDDRLSRAADTARGRATARWLARWQARVMSEIARRAARRSRT